MTEADKTATTRQASKDPTRGPLARVLDKLEWPALVEILSGMSQTDDGRVRCQELTPTLPRHEIEERWGLVEPLRVVAAQGYRPPIGALLPLGGVFRAARLGQILDGQSLRAVSDLLESVRKVYAFASDFSSRASTLRRTRSRLLPMPHLAQAINKAVGAEGELLDDASPELTRIRRAKVSVRRRIEEAITKLLHGSELEKYLQDDFFTVRSERYVVPMRLDGRGRVKGSILDTSDSGQTLFIEPAEIAPINDQLLELDLEEKLEIVRIFRELSAMVAADHETLKANYDELIELDFLSAQATLAAEIQGGPVQLVDEPTLELVGARHPLIQRAQGKQPIGNSVGLKPEQHALIVSGPNAGGKTVVLKTVGLLHLMAKAGLLLPADPESKLFLYDRIYLEMGDAQSLAASLSTFSGHLLGLKPILEQANGRDLALLDELAVGTDPQTGAAIGTAILEDLASRGVKTLVTTHFDALKGLAVNDRRFRNGSMEFALDRLTPTYRLILDVPGQSYGLEVAEQIGLPARILTRAKEMRLGHTSNLDKAVTELMLARDEARRSEALLAKSRLDAEAEKARWQEEVEHLKESRRKVSQQLTDKYESRIQELRGEFDELVKKLKQSAKEAQFGDAATRDAVLADRRAVEKTLRDMEGVTAELGQSYDASSKLPGQPATRETLAPNVPVFVLPLKKAGKVLRVTDDDTIEVEVGVIKLRVSSHDLRLLSAGEAAGAGGANKKQTQTKPPRSAPSTPPRTGTTGAREDSSIQLTLQTQMNTADLRGKDSLDAIQAAWNFIDRALLRGEGAVILIHGHGEGTLKAVIRDALRTKCPYDVRWRPGLDQEGGDGVTVVRLS